MERMTMYMLAVIRENGDEVFQGFFDSVEDIEKALKPRVTLSLNGTMLQATVSNISQYRVRTVEKNVIVSGPGFGELDLADEYVTFESKDTGHLYTFGIVDGDLTSCSCPSFVHTKSKLDEDCKHLLDARKNPSFYGLGKHVRHGKYLYYPLKKTQTLTEAMAVPNMEFFSQGIPRGTAKSSTFLGNPGSWRDEV